MVVLKESNNSKNMNYIVGQEYDFYYELYANNILVGEAAIRINSYDMLYIRIYDMYKGNNLGKEAFEGLMNKFRELNVDKISIIIDNSNIQMLRIVSHQKFKIINSGKNFKQYQVSIN